MKNCITQKQFDELSIEQLKELIDLNHNPYIFRIAYKEEYNMEVDNITNFQLIPSINIEYLLTILENKYENIEIYKQNNLWKINLNNINNSENIGSIELINELWSKVKELL